MTPVKTKAAPKEVVANNQINTTPKTNTETEFDALFDME